MLTPVRSTAFKKDVKRLAKRGKRMAKLKAVIEMLVEGESLDPRLRDHPLKGEWSGWRDLHIEPNWLLLYRVSGSELQLARTGTHSGICAGNSYLRSCHPLSTQAGSL